MFLQSILYSSDYVVIILFGKRSWKKELIYSTNNILEHLPYVETGNSLRFPPFGMNFCAGGSNTNTSRNSSPNITISSVRGDVISFSSSCNNETFTRRVRTTNLSP